MVMAAHLVPAVVRCALGYWTFTLNVGVPPCWRTYGCEFIELELFLCLFNRFVIAILLFWGKPQFPQRAFPCLKSQISWTGRPCRG